MECENCIVLEDAVEALTEQVMSQKNLIRIYRAMNTHLKDALLRRIEESDEIFQTMCDADDYDPEDDMVALSQPDGYAEACYAG